MNDDLRIMPNNEHNVHGDQPSSQESLVSCNEKLDTGSTHNLQKLRNEESNKNVEHNYAAKSNDQTPKDETVLPTQSVTTSDLDPLIKALLEQNQALINGLFINERYRDRSSTSSESSEYLVMPNFFNTLPEFDGRGNSQTAEDWLAAIEGVAKLHRWPDAFRIESARSRIVGPANNWFTGRKFTNWDEFVIQFNHTFVGSKLIIVERMKNMLKRVQSESETEANYFHHKARLCRELELPFDETKQQIVVG